MLILTAVSGCLNVRWLIEKLLPSSKDATCTWGADDRPIHTYTFRIFRPANAHAISFSLRHCQHDRSAPLVHAHNGCHGQFLILWAHGRRLASEMVYKRSQYDF